MRKRLRSHEGANAVEFALVLPILVLLLFGAITFGLAFNTKQQLEHANREGVRYAATVPVPGTEAWFKDVFERIVMTAAGQAPVTDPNLTICVSVEDEGTISSITRSGDPSYNNSDDMVGTVTTPDTTHCYADSLTGDRVQVTMVRDARLDAVFFQQTVKLHSIGVARYEG